MPRYEVTIKEVWDKTVEVNANTEEEAIDLAAEGFEAVKTNFEYSHCLDSSMWNVQMI